MLLQTTSIITATATATATTTATITGRLSSVWLGCQTCDREIASSTPGQCANVLLDSLGQVNLPG